MHFILSPSSDLLHCESVVKDFVFFSSASGGGKAKGERPRVCCDGEGMAVRSSLLLADLVGVGAGAVAEGGRC